MRVRALTIAAIVLGLCGPTAASADPPPLCVQVPVGTVGVHVEVGDEEVHVPAFTDVHLCAAGWPPEGEPLPVRLEVYLWCGFPCFTLVVEEGEWTAASTRVTAWLAYTADGVPTEIPLVDVPIAVVPDNPNPVCVAVGNPIPECPENSLVVPVPAP